MYPTKEDILRSPPSFKPETLEIICRWKQKFMKYWKTYNNESKILILNKLINCIQIMENNGIQLAKIKTTTEYQYNPRTRTIYHNKNNPSIISSLHELAHHLYGEDELIACKWSINLFRTTFPKSYAKLEWENHLLIKKNEKT